MKPFFLACLNEALHFPVIFIAKNSKDARRLYDEEYIPNAVHFPSKDMEFQRFDARSREDENQRVAALKALLNQSAGVVFTSYDALLPKLTPADLFKNQLLEIETGRSYPIEDIFRACVRLGYNPESLVEGEGAIAKRGSIIDIYIPAESAYRIDFFGDEVESIRQFDPLTQRTLETSVSKITISSATEFVLDEAAIPRAVKTLTEETEKTPNSQTEEDITLIQSGQSFEGIDKYLYAFYDGASLFDYTNSPVIVYDSQDLAKKEADVYFNECKHDWMVCTASGEAGSGQIQNLFPVETADSILQDFPQVEFASIKRSPDFNTSKEIVFQIKSPAAYLHRLDMLAADIKLRLDQRFKPCCFTGDERNSRVLKNAFVQGGISSIDEIIISAPLESGAEFPESKCLILGEKDIFGFRKKRAEAPSRETSLDIFTDLDEGDIVVHELHGRGRYLGLFTMEVQGKKRDYILLEYKDGDKLYIPTEQIDRVQKYIGGEAPALSKLGGREWDAAKAKVSKSIKKLAVDLVSVYSDRSGSKGFVFSPDSAWQDDFESSFPYQETDGQIKCVAEIKKDMESKKVMDRLLLGDVGYGKTEVAMRACFKAVYDQKQVAVLVPTTLLARQHFETFSERFKGFPVKVAQLSRFVAEKEKKKTLAALSRG